jgi:hypothetical protein
MLKQFLFQAQPRRPMQGKSAAASLASLGSRSSSNDDGRVKSFFLLFFAFSEHAHRWSQGATLFDELFAADSLSSVFTLLARAVSVHLTNPFCASLIHKRIPSLRVVATFALIRTEHAAIGGLYLNLNQGRLPAVNRLLQCIGHVDGITDSTPWNSIFICTGFWCATGLTQAKLSLRHVGPVTGVGECVRAPPDSHLHVVDGTEGLLRGHFIADFEGDPRKTVGIEVRSPVEPSHVGIS